MKSLAFILLLACSSLVSADDLRSATTDDIAVARQRISSGIADGAIASPGKVIVVYFTPKGRPPAANHIERTRRIVNETASFYEDELARHGFPNRSMNVHRDADGKVAVIDVIGKETDYDKPDGDKVREEIIPELRKRKLAPNKSVLLIICNLMGLRPESQHNLSSQSVLWRR